MRKIELTTLLLDFAGLILISWSLFSISKPLEFTFNQEYGVITSLKPIADAINSISRDFALIYKMRVGFLILCFSLVLKLINWFIECRSKIITQRQNGGTIEADQTLNPNKVNTADQNNDSGPSSNAAGR